MSATRFAELASYAIGGVLTLGALLAYSVGGMPMLRRYGRVLLVGGLVAGWFMFGRRKR